jgi:putative tryptophan/tyrosine transport system substrate-binding protein
MIVNDLLPQILKLEDCKMRRREFIAGLGGTAASPLLVRAQQQTTPIIGYLSVRSGGPPHEWVEGFRRGFAKVGFSEGRDVTIEYHNPDGHIEQLSALAADVVRRKPAAIIVIGVLPTLAAKAATRDIPLIFSVGIDPVEFGLVPSFNRPGGNLTGIAAFGAEIVEKRLELLHTAAPAVETIALLIGPVGPYSQVETRHVRSTARILGLRLLVFEIATDADVTPAVATLVERQAGAIVVGGSPIPGGSSDQIISHAARFALPTMFAYPDDARAGGLLSYGPEPFEIIRQLTAYTGRILKGEKPGDLPVIQPTKYEFVINLKTATALGLTVPPNLLATADKVIE